MINYFVEFVDSSPTPRRGETMDALRFTIIALAAEWSTVIKMPRMLESKTSESSGLNPVPTGKTKRRAPKDGYLKSNLSMCP